MSPVRRDPATGKFYREGDEETFIRITNEDIWHKLGSMDSRLAKVENRLGSTARFWAMITPTVTCVAGVVTSFYYLRGH